MKSRLPAHLLLGAALACLATIVGAGLAGGRLLEAILLNPLRWLYVPALIGAAAGAAVSALRTR